MYSSASRGRERVYEQTKQTLTCVIISFICLFDKQLLQKKALERVLGEIDSTFGKGSIMKLGSAGQAKVATFPSGAMTLDMALGGGLPRGRIVEIYGPESSGKTTLAMHAMAEMQKLGGTVALIDAEHAFDPDLSLIHI